MNPQLITVRNFHSSPLILPGGYLLEPIPPGTYVTFEVHNVTEFIDSPAIRGLLYRGYVHVSYAPEQIELEENGTDMTSAQRHLSYRARVCCATEIFHQCGGISCLFDADAALRTYEVQNVEAGFTRWGRITFDSRPSDPTQPLRQLILRGGFAL